MDLGEDDDFQFARVPFEGLLDGDSHSSLDVDVVSMGRRRRRNRRRRSYVRGQDILVELAAFLNSVTEPNEYARSDCMDDSDYDDDNESTFTDQKLHTLLDLASRQVAKHYTCTLLEENDPPLDESLLRGVAYWSFPQDENQVRAYANITSENNWERAVRLVRDNKVREMCQVGFMASAYIMKFAGDVTAENGGSDIRVSLTFERQKIMTSSCSECRNEVWCVHVVTAVIYRIRFPDKVRVHAPMTETLSTLDRNQLQKLLQYAVQEDPAGILGKVFKHLDDVRDSTSAMNTIQGAPDPTFGGSQGTKTQWQMSIDSLEKKLCSVLNDMCLRRSVYNSFYPVTYDYVKKLKSEMYQYIARVLELGRQNETVAAADVLLHITTLVVNKIKAMHGSDCPSLCYFAHDLVHIYTLLLLHPMLDPHAKSRLLLAVKKFNSIQRVADFHLENSNWAELPSIKMIYGSRVAKDSDCPVFLEPMCAELVPPWPQELKDLIDGKNTSEQSKYDEDAVVMLARMETLFHLDASLTLTKMAVLGTKIIRKLTHLVHEDSIIGAYLGGKTSSTGKVLDLLKSAGSSGTTRTVSPGRRTPGRKKSLSKGKSSAKRQKTSHGSVTTQLSKGQIAYSMLFTLRTIIASQQVNKQQFENPTLLAGFCLLALELSRHRTVASRGTVTEAEHDWLLTVENMISDYLQSISNEAASAAELYLDALVTVGCEFYNDEYPLVLLEILLHIYQKNPDMERTRANHIVHICANILQNINGALSKYTLPTSNPVFLDINYDFMSTSKKTHKDFAIKKLHVIVETFLSHIDMDKQEHVSLLVKVLRQFENMSNPVLLRHMSRDLRLHGGKLQEDEGVLEGTIKVILHAMKKTTPFSFWPSQSSRDIIGIEQNFLFSLCKKLGIGSLRLILGRWQESLQCTDIKDFIIMFREELLSHKTLPPEAVLLIKEYFAARLGHDEDACVLLSFFKPLDANYKHAVRSILDNYLDYHGNTLFELAKMDLKARNENKADVMYDIMDEEAFPILQKALSRLKCPSSFTSKTNDHIDWMCKALTAGNLPRLIAKSTLYTDMIKLVIEQNNPEIILRVLHNLELSSGVLFRTASKLKNALLQAYQHHFSRRLQNGSHSSYNTAINEMHRAKLYCQQYLKNGDAQFVTEVVNYIKQCHSGKKKLHKMLDEEFGTKQ